MVDVTTDHEALSFMDGSFGYTQIRMASEDEELTVFRIPKVIYCYKHHGIEVDQSKIKAIQSMPEPMNLHELKSLQGQLAFIRRFISNLARRRQPFSRLMKKNALSWDDVCRNAFESIKRYLASPLILGASMPGKPLILYIIAQEGSIRALLAQENED
ncbi:hypothetical protein ACFXTN_012150 [Malus domestica]